jgi:molecular chaperone GrpE
MIQSTDNMKSNNNSNNKEEFSAEIDVDDLASIDDFIKELEARERDLHISPEMVIEIEDSEFEADSEFDLESAPESMSTEIITEGLLISETVVPDKVPANKAKISELQEMMEQLKSQISKMETERTDLFELSRRRQTDFDNYKMRTERDRDETFGNQLSNLAIQILPVLDNLSRALNSASLSPENKPQDFQQFYDGIVMVNRQLNEVMREIGVEPIPAVSQTFDPHFHEAVATEPSSEFPSNTVIEELLRGYQIGEKVIRPAMVKVSTASNSATNSSPETN